MSYNWKCCSFYPNNFGASALTPTEIHMYPDRGTHVPRSGYDNYLISFRSFSDDSCLFKKAPFIISFRSFSDDSCLFKKAPFISSSAPCVS